MNPYGQLSTGYHTNMYDYLGMNRTFSDYNRRAPTKRGRGPFGKYSRTKRRKYSIGSKLGYSRTELKFADSTLNAATIGATWAPLNPITKDCLNAVVQGPGESEHLGRTMYMTSIHLKGFFKKVKQEAGADPTGDIILRLALVLDTDTKGAEVTATDVMDTGGTSDTFSFRNLQHTFRLKVLKDHTIIMRQFNLNEGAVNTFAHGERRVKWAMNHRFKTPIRVLFSGTTAVVGSIVDNSIHLIAIATLTGVTLTYECRLRFKDNL